MALEPRRESAFQEAGLLSPSQEASAPTSSRKERPQNVRFRSKDEIHMVNRYEHKLEEDDFRQSRLHDGSPSTRYIDLSQSPLPDWGHSMMYRLGAALLVLVAMIPLLQSSAIFGHNSAMPIKGVSGSAIPANARLRSEKRANSPTDACFRWAQQCKVLYG